MTDERKTTAKQLTKIYAWLYKPHSLPRLSGENLVVYVFVCILFDFVQFLFLVFFFFIDVIIILKPGPEFSGISKIFAQSQSSVRSDSAVAFYDFRNSGLRYFQVL
jgi:hypothetical protein